MPDGQLLRLAEPKKSNRANIAVFIPHTGCPHQCSFCNQRTITGKSGKEAIIPEKLGCIIEEQAVSLRKQGRKAEIAFFGGTFTALEHGYMESLLNTAKSFAENYPDVVCGLRCSTRPDAVSIEILDTLKRYGMTAIELGAQSMDDGVLQANGRGHSAEDTKKAAALIKSRGFELGLQMMTGLYRDTPELSVFSAEEIIRLKPDTVRIYPTVVMPETTLAELYSSGEYKCMGFEETVDLCALLYGMFTENGIRVIRIGLNAEAEVERKMLGGNYHPAMGELCISRYYFHKMRDFMLKSKSSSFTIETDRSFVSKIIGQRSCNRKMLENLGYTFRIVEKENQAPVINENID